MEIRLKGIYKSFGTDRALQGVDFMALGGEICGIVGESGAGKSALADILGGAASPDRGEITIDGAPVSFHPPGAAIKAGVALVRQEPCRVGGMPVYAYMFLGREIAKFGVTREKAMHDGAKSVFAEIGAGIDPLAPMSSIGEIGRLLVCICRAFLHGARAIVLDEAIECFSGPIKGKIIDKLVSLKDSGVAVVVATRSFKAAAQVCSRLAVLKDGAVAGEYRPDQISEGMMKRFAAQKPAAVPSQPLASPAYAFRVRCGPLSFHAASGEILGVAGRGGLEFFKSLLGMGKPFKGKVYLREKAVRLKGLSMAAGLGVAFVPGGCGGIFPGMGVMDNMCMLAWGLVSGHGFIHRGEQEALCGGPTEALRIHGGRRHRPISEAPSASRQKTALARSLLLKPQVVILDSPARRMRELDREDVYEAIFGLAREGASVIVVSNDCGELARLCGRVLIMRGGWMLEIPGGPVGQGVLEEWAAGGP